MDVPAAIAHPVVVAEPGAGVRVGVNAAIIAVAVLVPSVSAILLRPANPGEGYAFLVLGVALVWWQLRRLRRSGVALAPDGIARAGDRVVPWRAVTEVHWDTTRTAGPSGRPVRVHRLVAATADGQEVGLTRWPSTDAQADRLAAALRDAGLDVRAPATPDRW